MKLHEIFSEPYRSELKYFTREWYEEMQISGFLIFHETEQDWDQDVAWYHSEGMDIEEIRRYDLENRKTGLLKFLPESFHPYIRDGMINT